MHVKDDGKADFARAVSYAHKMFMKLTTGSNPEGPEAWLRRLLRHPLAHGRPQHRAEANSPDQWMQSWPLF